MTALPRATLETLPRSGHLPWFDEPERAAAAVRRFLLGAGDVREVSSDRPAPTAEAAPAR